jgi:hypothetical protein
VKDYPTVPTVSDDLGKIQFDNQYVIIFRGHPLVTNATAFWLGGMPDPLTDVFRQLDQTPSKGRSFALSWQAVQVTASATRRFSFIIGMGWPDDVITPELTSPSGKADVPAILMTVFSVCAFIGLFVLVSTFCFSTRPRMPLVSQGPT